MTGPVAPDHFERFLGQVAAALGMESSSSADVWQGGPATIRFGRVRVRGTEEAPPSTELMKLATLAYSLRDEREAVAWVHQEASEEGRIPALEAYGVVQSLSLAMRGGQAMMLPLLELKEFDQYTTTHAINVAVLTMGLAEFLGMGPALVRGFGLAGLLHDLGKVRIPREILTKPGKLTPEEREDRRGPSGRRGADDPRRAGADGSRGDGGLRAPPPRRRSRIPRPALSPRGPPGQPTGARLRRLRRAPDQASVSRRMDVDSRADLHPRTRGHRVRSRWRSRPSRA